MAMPATPVDLQSVEVLVEAFRARLAGALPFREDSALAADLDIEAAPVLEALARGYRVVAEGGQAAQHEGFALLRLFCRRAALLGATPTASLVLARAIETALIDTGIAISDSAREHLAIVAIEGYCAGRDEQRERSLRASASASQVWFTLAPRCFVVCPAGSHLVEQLEQLLDGISRTLFRADAHAVLLDLSRLQADDEDSARLLVSFCATQLGLGAHVLLCDVSAPLDVWFGRLQLAQHRVERCEGFAAGVARALSLCGYELRARGRLGELMERMRSGSR
jgi:anti-anti-sigma regulatory factor